MLKRRSSGAFSYASAQKKITALEQRGYHFVGNLPYKTEVWATLRTGLFLFVKGSCYYQYQASDLLSTETPLVEFDRDHEPVGKRFSNIVTGDYIYVIFTQKAALRDEMVVLLRKNASLSGHAHLVGPYKELAENIVCGEVYYYNKELLLINHKSGSFPTLITKALPLIQAVWGVPGEQLFYPIVEKEGTLLEVQKRLDALTAAKVSASDAVSSLEEQAPALPTHKPKSGKPATEDGLTATLPALNTKVGKPATEDGLTVTLPALNNNVGKSVTEEILPRALSTLEPGPKKPITEQKNTPSMASAVYSASSPTNSTFFANAACPDADNLQCTKSCVLL